MIPNDVIRLLAEHKDAVRMNVVASVLGISISTAHKYATKGLVLPNGHVIRLQSYLLNNKRWVREKDLQEFVALQSSAQEMPSSDADVREV